MVFVFVSVGLLIALVLNADAAQQPGAWVFCIGMIILYTCSTLYHVPNWAPEMKAEAGTRVAEPTA